MAATLGITAISFVPYCFFNLLNPLVSILFAIFGIRMLTAKTSAAVTTTRDAT